MTETMDTAHGFNGPWVTPVTDTKLVALYCNDAAVSDLYSDIAISLGLGICALHKLTDPKLVLHGNTVDIIHFGDESDIFRTGLSDWDDYIAGNGNVTICSTTVALVDRVMATFVSESTLWLVDAQPHEVALTLMSAMDSRNRGSKLTKLRENGPEDAQAALIRLTDELARMGRWLTAISDRDAPAGQDALHQGPVSYRPGPDRRATPNRSLDATRVRSEIAARRLRNRFFDDQLFGEPCWDMLLDLFAARLEDNRVSVSSLCIAAAVPPTTALRWIKYMTEVGLIERIADTADARRVFVRLSDDAATRMTGWFEAQGD